MYEFIIQNVKLFHVVGALGLLMVGMLAGGFIVNHGRGTPGSKSNMRHDLTITRVVNVNMAAEATKVPVYYVAYRNAMGNDTPVGYTTDVEVARTYIGTTRAGCKAYVLLREAWQLTEGVVTATDPVKMLDLIERYGEDV